MPSVYCERKFANFAEKIEFGVFWGEEEFGPIRNSNLILFKSKWKIVLFSLFFFCLFCLLLLYLHQIIEIFHLMHIFFSFSKWLKEKENKKIEKIKRNYKSLFEYNQTYTLFLLIIFVNGFIISLWIDPVKIFFFFYFVLNFLCLMLWYYFLCWFLRIVSVCVYNGERVSGNGSIFSTFNFFSRCFFFIII